MLSAFEMRKSVKYGFYVSLLHKNWRLKCKKDVDLQNTIVLHFYFCLFFNSSMV
jgi:hypothetical protein